jgi:hypothetical protein
MSADLVELVWRKQGEERCEWTPRTPTEKKALPMEPSATENTIPDYEQTEFIEKNTEFLPRGGEAGGAGGGQPLVKMGGEAGGAGGVQPPNKRETANEKMNERYLVGQPIQNPFMSNSNYANDLEVQMNFLTPSKG